MNAYWYVKGFVLAFFNESMFKWTNITFLSILFIINALIVIVLIIKVPKKWKWEVGILSFHLLLWFFLWENLPEVNEIEYHIGKEPLKIVHLTDFHFNTSQVWIIDRAIREANSKNPDIVVLTGDYKTDISQNDLSPWIFDKLKKIKAKKGVYLIFGNHDNFQNPTKMKKEFEDCGITLVHKKNIEISPDMYLTGLDFEDIYFRDLRASLKDLPDRSVFLFHSPRQLFEGFFDIKLIEGKNVLFLTGHTHGGQFLFPWTNKDLKAQQELGIKHLNGWLDLGEHKVYVSKGLGTSYFPLRLRAKPEVTVINILPE